MMRDHLAHKININPICFLGLIHFAKHRMHNGIHPALVQTQIIYRIAAFTAPVQNMLHIFNTFCLHGNNIACNLLHIFILRIQQYILCHRNCRLMMRNHLYNKIIRNAVRQFCGGHFFYHSIQYFIKLCKILFGLFCKPARIFHILSPLSVYYMRCIFFCEVLILIEAICRYKKTDTA